MSSNHNQGATAAKHNLTPGYSSKKSVEQKIQDSLTLNSHLYAPPNVIERLGQGSTTSKREYRVQATTAIVAFDEAFRGKK